MLHPKQSEIIKYCGYRNFESQVSSAILHIRSESSGQKVERIYRHVVDRLTCHATQLEVHRALEMGMSIEETICMLVAVAFGDKVESAHDFAKLKEPTSY